MARIMYIGAVVIQADQPLELARWYSEKFGVPATFEHEGGYYGAFDTASGQVHFGIVPREDATSKGCANITVTFRVNDFPGYMRELQKRGLQPIGSSRGKAGAGEFASFRDPEGNEIGIWGD